MRKLIFISILCFLSVFAKGQVYQLMPQYGYDAKRMNFDSTISIPTFCGNPSLLSNKTKKAAIAFDSCNNRFYYYNPKLATWDTIRSGTTIDTTNRFVNSVVKVNDSTFRVFKGSTSSDISISSVTSATRLITIVYNKSGALIPRGAVVYIDGAHSSVLPSIALAKANAEPTSAYTYGLVVDDIANNSSGTVIQSGTITNLNLPTSSYTDGQTLYLSPSVAGGYTTTKPTAPNHYVAIGTITRAHPVFGTIQVAIRNGFQLDEMSDVQIPAVPDDSALLQFSRVDSLWHSVNPTNAIGNRYIKPSDTANIWVTSIYRKIASDSVFYVKGGLSTYAFKDSAGSAVIQQTYTNGSSITCNNATTWLIINPSSLQSTLTINLPSSPSSNQDIIISFGGTMTSGIVVNTLTLSPSPLQSTTPKYIEVGESISYRWNATNSKWYRIN